MVISGNFRPFSWHFWNTTLYTSQKECCEIYPYYPAEDTHVDTSIIEHPATETTIYVDALNGNNNNDGSTEETAFETLKKACQVVTDKTTILVKSGTYYPSNFGTGNLNLFPVCTLNQKTDIKITNFQGHSPVIEFDGNAGFSVTDGLRIEISGFEIIGAAYSTDLESAKLDQETGSNYRVFFLKCRILG